MADAAKNPDVTKLSALLDREKRALLTGNLDALTHMAVEKEALLERLGALAATDHEALSALREKIERNQVLLRSALDGIREVSDRIKALRKAHRSLETYDRLGQRSQIRAGAGQKIEKRA